MKSAKGWAGLPICKFNNPYKQIAAQESTTRMETAMSFAVVWYFKM
jgi:hypothetical protein